MVFSSLLTLLDDIASVLRLRELEEQCDLLMQAQAAQAEIAKDT